MCSRFLPLAILQLGPLLGKHVSSTFVVVGCSRRPLKSPARLMFHRVVMSCARPKTMENKLPSPVPLLARGRVRDNVIKLSGILPRPHPSRRRLEKWRLLRMSGNLISHDKIPLTLRRPHLLSGRLEGCLPPRTLLNLMTLGLGRGPLTQPTPRISEGDEREFSFRSPPVQQPSRYQGTCDGRCAARSCWACWCAPAALPPNRRR